MCVWIFSLWSWKKWQWDKKLLQTQRYRNSSLIIDNMSIKYILPVEPQISKAKWTLSSLRCFWASHGAQLGTKWPLGQMMTKMSLKFEVYKPLVSMRGEGINSPKNDDAIFEQPLTTSRVVARSRHNCISSSAHNSLLFGQTVNRSQKRNGNSY